MNKKIMLFIVIFFCCVFMTGCWDNLETNDLALTVCIGIDKTENGYLVSQQVLNPKAIASKNENNESKIIVYTEEGKDLLEIYRKMSLQCPRKIYNAHLRIVVFGEEVARDGIKDLIDFFARNHEFRTDFNFIVAKGKSANEVLGTLTTLETISGNEMYNSLETSENVWAPTKSIKILELSNDIISDGINPVLPGIEITDGDNSSNSIDALKKSNSIKKLKYDGLGVFEKDKLVGWLNENESKGYNYITDNVKSTAGYAYYGDKVKITYEVVNAKSQVKANLVNDKPVINVKIKLVENISQVEGDFEVNNKKNEDILKGIAQDKVKKICEEALKKMQNDFKVDIFGFGEAIHRRYPKVWEKMKDNWIDEFPNIPVEIEVEVKINQLGQITKPLFIKEKK